MKTSLPEGNITLRDGRHLAYAEYGDTQGNPIFFFHGTPGSRLFHHPDASIAASAGARIIAVDRPGFGRSDFKLGRTLLDWPNDVVQLADALNIDRFAVVGYSGGGPYAAVCASSIPDRLTAAGLVSSIAPMDNPEITRGMHGIGHTYFSLERHLPPLAKLGCWLMCTTWRHNPDLYFRAQLNGLRNSEEAQTLLSTMKPMLTSDFQEAVRVGTDGITWDLEILTRPWGFQLHVINTDVFLWHGENDTQAPLAMGKRLAGAIPHCRATFFPGEGHWAIYTHWQEILTALARAEAQPATIAIASEHANSGAPIAVLPLDSGIEIVDMPADSMQGLQPAREVTAMPEETPVSASPEPEPVQEAPKTASKKTAKRRAVAVAETPAVVTPEQERVQEAPKLVSKKAAKRSTAAEAETPLVVTPKSKPVQEATKLVSKKATKRSTAAVAETPTATTPEPEPVQEAPKPVSKKTSKRAATATTGAPRDEAVEPKPLPQKAKGAAKRTAKPKAAVVKPPSAAVTEGSASQAEPPEPTPAKPSYRRKAAKEAVLV
jgi:pimeloyl-ACP methyl ester carboxylesterase